MHCYFGNLSPTPHVFWHVLEFYRLLQKVIHLLLDGVRSVSGCVPSGVINADHICVSGMLARGAAHVIEFGIEDVGLMAFISDSVVDDKLQHDLFRVVTHVSEVLSVAAHHLSVSI